MTDVLQKLVHDLAQKSSRFDRLMADPHPGLYSWNMMAVTAYNEVMDAAKALSLHVSENANKEDKRDPVFFGG